MLSTQDGAIFRGMRANLFIQNFGRTLRILACVFVLAVICTTTPLKKAYAFACIDSQAMIQLPQDHLQGQLDISLFIAQEFNEHRTWLTNDFAIAHVIPALQLFTEQMTAVSLQQAMAIGSFFDAKHQLESQRLFQELQLQAHKDYQPSTSFCAFGTNVRSLAHSETAARYNSFFMSQRQLARHLGLVNMAGQARALGTICGALL